MALVDVAATIYDSAEENSGKSTKQVVSDSEDSANESRLTPPKCMEKLSFAEQLMTVIDDESYPFLTWMPDGKSFTIKNPKLFTAELMPKLFNIRNMSSFVRKLSRWGFQRYHEKETMNSDLFRHKEFKRGDWKSCSQIKCTAGRHPVTSLSRRPSLPTTSPIKSPVSPKHGYSTNTVTKSVSVFNQARKAQPMPHVHADATLKSLVLERDLMQALSVPEVNAKVMALQVLNQASVQHQEQLSRQAMIHLLLEQSMVDVNRARLALAGSLAGL